MPSRDYILAIDQGTTSTRAIVFGRGGEQVALAQRELPQIYPQDGWVEHDPEEIWRATVDVCRRAMASTPGGVEAIAAIGITNQRETTVVWDRKNWQPIYNAIVWQDRRTTLLCRELEASGIEPLVAQHTGLLIDPYFSATKIAWMLDEVPDARPAALRGELAFGTIDCFLLWRLTGGAVHATDATNASRTMLFDIHSQGWSPTMLHLFGVPPEMLPEVYDSASAFGETEPELFGRAIPICGMAGDQQAAAIGQACFEPGMVKATLGTGCFVLLNTGDKAAPSSYRLLSTVANRLNGSPVYGLEGSIFIAGAAVQWLRDGLVMIDTASETEALAASLESNRGVYMVPAFTGLGAPHWDPEARGALFGLTRDTGIADIARAALESVCYQVMDLIMAMEADIGEPLSILRVDGGMATNDWLLQFMADMTGVPVERPVVTETTALGAAYLAGLECGFYGSLAEIADHWKRDRLFEPKFTPEQRHELKRGWDKAIARVQEKDF